MFEKFFGNPEHEREDELIRRQEQFGREQQIMSAQTNPNEELAYRDFLRDRTDLLKWQQDLDDELYKMVMELRGFSRTDDGWEKIPNTKPLCNDKFIFDVIIPQCEPFLSRNMINSNFSEKTILSDLKFTCNEIADNMADGYDIYGIDPINYDLILRKIKNVIKAGSFRSINGWTKKTDSTVSRRLESISESGLIPQKKGLFDAVK